MLTYDQALKSRIFNNSSFQNDDGTFCLLWGCFNCSIWGDMDCVDTDTGSTITEFVTVDVQTRPSVWKVVTQDTNDTYIQLPDTRCFVYANGTFINYRVSSILDPADVPPKVVQLARVYGNYGY